MRNVTGLEVNVVGAKQTLLVLQIVLLHVKHVSMLSSRTLEYSLKPENRWSTCIAFRTWHRLWLDRVVSRRIYLIFLRLFMLVTSHRQRIF